MIVKGKTVENVNELRNVLIGVGDKKMKIRETGEQFNRSYNLPGHPDSELED
jgi:hypothetical protein